MVEIGITWCEWHTSNGNDEVVVATTERCGFNCCARCAIEYDNWLEADKREREADAYAEAYGPGEAVFDGAW
jgi:hypothetical protein